MMCYWCSKPTDPPYCSEKCAQLDRALVDQLTYHDGDPLVPTGIHSGDIDEKHRAQGRLAQWDAREAQ